jgi:hypothetical protein
VRAIAVVGLLGLWGCEDAVIVDPSPFVSPGEVFLDIGTVPYDEVTRTSFTITSSSRTGTVLALELGQELPHDFVLEPTMAQVRAGQPATFTLTFRPCGMMGPREFEMFLASSRCSSMLRTLRRDAFAWR